MGSMTEIVHTAEHQQVVQALNSKKTQMNIVEGLFLDAGSRKKTWLTSKGSPVTYMYFVSFYNSIFRDLFILR